jgi:hypothetical protein
VLFEHGSVDPERLSGLADDDNGSHIGERRSLDEMPHSFSNLNWAILLLILQGDPSGSIESTESST